MVREQLRTKVLSTTTRADGLCSGRTGLRNGLVVPRLTPSLVDDGLAGDVPKRRVFVYSIRRLLTKQKTVFGKLQGKSNNLILKKKMNLPNCKNVLFILLYFYYKTKQILYVYRTVSSKLSISVTNFFTTKRDTNTRTKGTSKTYFRLVSEQLQSDTTPGVPELQRKNSYPTSSERPKPTPIPFLCLRFQYTYFTPQTQSVEPLKKVKRHFTI